MTPLSNLICAANVSAAARIPTAVRAGARGGERWRGVPAQHLPVDEAIRAESRYCLIISERWPGAGGAAPLCPGLPCSAPTAPGMRLHHRGAGRRTRWVLPVASRWHRRGSAHQRTGKLQVKPLTRIERRQQPRLLPSLNAANSSCSALKSSRVRPPRVCAQGGGISGHPRTSQLQPFPAMLLRPQSDAESKALTSLLSFAF